MSEKAIAQFTAKLAEDPALQQEMRLEAGIGDGDTVTTGALIEFAASKGYEFTVDEVQASELELSDAQLEAVAGGAAFVKYDGVDGEATDRDHKGWTDLLSFSSMLSFSTRLR